jgi:CRP-like cAMP-binding protein
MSGFERVQFEPGELLFNAGDPADKLYVVESGTVQMLDAKTRAPFANVGKGQSFGEAAILPGGIRSASAVAVDAVSCLVISGANLQEMLARQSPILLPLVETLLLQQSMHNALRRRS